MEKPSCWDRPVSSRVKYSLLIEVDHGAIAPCARLFSGSGTTRSGSTSLRVPMPVHSGQAPNGELKENDRGSIASKDSPSSTQARCSEKVRSRCASSSGRSTKSRTTRPPARPSAVRSEEHTSELQSRQYLVCRLL